MAVDQIQAPNNHFDMGEAKDNPNALNNDAVERAPGSVASTDTGSDADRAVEAPISPSSQHNRPNVPANKSNVWRWLVVGLALLVLIGLLIRFGGTRSGGEDVEDRTQVVWVKTTSLKPQTDLQIPIWYSGEVIARRKTSVGFQRSGTLVEILFDEGDEVAAGQTLARLDRRQSMARLAQLKAEQATAQARLDELVQGPRGERILAAEASVEELARRLENARIEMERAARLRQQQAVSQQEFDQAETAVSALAAQLEAATARRDELVTGTREERLIAARQQLQAATAMRALARHDLNDCELKAPFAGSVIRRFVDEGSVLDTGSPVLEIVEADQLEMHVGVPPSTAAGLIDDQKVQVRIGQHFLEARVRTRLQAIDPLTRTRKVILDLPPDEFAVDGALGQVMFEQTIATPGFRIPVSAIVNDSRGLWSCYTLATNEDGETVVRRQSIEVLHFDGEEVFVRGTVSPDQRIVLDGLQRLTHNQVVNVAEPGAAEPN